MTARELDIDRWGRREGEKATLWTARKLIGTAADGYTGTEARGVWALFNTKLLHLRVTLVVSHAEY